MAERGAPGIFRDALFILFLGLVSMGMFPCLEYTELNLQSMDFLTQVLIFNKII